MNKIIIKHSMQDHNITTLKTTEMYHAGIVADLIVADLKRHPVEVYIIPDGKSTDWTINYSNNVFKPNVFIDFHTNAGGGHGTSIYGWKVGQNTNSEKLCKNIYKYLAPLTPPADRGVKDGYSKGFWVTNKVKATSCIVEALFHDCSDEMQWYIKNYKPIAVAVSKGILEYLGVAYIPEPTPKPEEVLYRVYVNGTKVGAFEVKDNAIKKADEYDEGVIKVVASTGEVVLDVTKVKQQPPVVSPPETPTEEPEEEIPNWFIRILKALIEFLNTIIKK